MNKFFIFFCAQTLVAHSIKNALYTCREKLSLHDISYDNVPIIFVHGLGKVNKKKIKECLILPLLLITMYQEKVAPEEWG